MQFHTQPAQGDPALAAGFNIDLRQRFHWIAPPGSRASSLADGAYVSQVGARGFLDLAACNDRPKVGDVVRVVPNHICPVVNLQEREVQPVVDALIRRFRHDVPTAVDVPPALAQ